MPDWSYRTLLRPALFALPARVGRDVALGTIGTLARLPLGGFTIDLLGHMRPAKELRTDVLGRTFLGPLGFAAELDPSGYALAGLARFGVGFAELGPVTPSRPARANVDRDDSRAAIVVDGHYTEISIDDACSRMQALPRDFPVIARVRGDEEGWHVTQRLARLPHVVALAIEGPIASTVPPECASLPLLIVVGAHERVEDVEHSVADAQAKLPRCDGVLLLGRRHEGERLLIGEPLRAPVLELVSALRARFAAGFAIIAGGGVHEPAQALALRDAGADLVRIDTGLVFSGPGLIKRANEALVARQANSRELEIAEVPPASQRAWFWLWLMGLAMFGGGALALAIAGTRVVLPYDEQFVGMTRDELDAINPRLLPFMSHDRVTLAGTMLALGILYSGLAQHAVRRGFHWAWVAIIASAVAGFLSFFLFLGFGYFEPFHAFVSTGLLQLLLLGWHSPLGRPQYASRVPLLEEWRWRRVQWGQLLLVIESVALIVGGLVISFVGSTSVFVAEDLEYMRTCASDLAAASPRLLALVAHDRATFGGMLISCGIVMLLATMWGFAAGRAWLWRTLLSAGVVGYGCTIAVHFLVGYVDFFHLLPAYAGFALHLAALGLAWPYLRWREYVEW